VVRNADCSRPLVLCFSNGNPKRLMVSDLGWASWCRWNGWHARLASRDFPLYRDAATGLMQTRSLSRSMVRVLSPRECSRLRLMPVTIEPAVYP
jgi:hypothetical protein